MLALIVVGAADSVSTIIRNTIRQLQTPDYIRGRMVSINQIFFAGGPQLGEIEAGITAQLFGAPFAVISGGIQHFAGITTAVSSLSVLLAFGVSFTVGLVFGIVPAWRAAQQDPVVCLRYE